MAKLNLDISNIDTTDNSSILPVGDYQMQIVQSEIRNTKAGDGQYLWLELEILGPKYAGRKFWDRLNIINKNETAVSISKRKLASICAACGIVNTLDDSERLHFKPMRVTVKHRENKRTNELEVDASYGSVSESAPAATPAPASMASAPKPWERHKK